MNTSVIRRLALIALFVIGMSISNSESILLKARAQSPESRSTPGKSLVDDLSQIYKINHYKEVAEGGPLRGENIYLYKCWACHNSYAKTGPPLKGVFTRPKLVSGDPVSDETVVARIKKGASAMPAFQYSLTDTDVADIISYLRDPKCCFEAEDPPANPLYRAETHKWSVPNTLKGGPRGVVRSSSGGLLDGVKVQLIAPNGVRTTVMSDYNGAYEFPVMQAGAYTIHIATPAPYQPYRKDNVQISGPTKLEEINLQPISGPDGQGSPTGALPATPEIEAQLSGAELLWNLPGTAQEKSTFAKTCGGGCHSYQQIFRVRFDERSWGILVDRMLRYSGNSLVNRTPQMTFGREAERDTVVKWLAKVRGPESKDDAYRLFPSDGIPSGRAVITEYELPRRLVNAHDVYGDSKGNIWYTSHRTPYAGVLDPRTGIVKEYRVPMKAGAMPGTHHVAVDKNGIVWFSEVWAHQLTRLDPSTGELKQMAVETDTKINSPGFYNFGLAPDGFIWHGSGREIHKIDPNTGKAVARYPLEKNQKPYENMISWDGRYYAAGSPPGMGFNTALLMDIKTGKMLELNSGDKIHSAARGGFDPFGNAWLGGRDGVLVKVDSKQARIQTYRPPTAYFPYTVFYDAMPDKNGEIWAGILPGRGFLRFNPKTERWWMYELPERIAHDRRTWVDNSTTPVTVWYVDFHTGSIVRIQPLD